MLEISFTDLNLVAHYFYGGQIHLEWKPSTTGECLYNIQGHAVSRKTWDRVAESLDERMRQLGMVEVMDNNERIDRLAGSKKVSVE